VARYGGRELVRLRNQLTKRLRSPTSIPVDDLLTPNRRDVQYRIGFLEAVIEDGRAYESTRYYHFIADPARGADCDPLKMSEGYEGLFYDIKQQGIREPMTATAVSGKTVLCRALVDGEKHWQEVPNETGYQIVDGAHRVAVAAYLGLETVPAYVVSPPEFEIPDYTEFIRRRNPEYERAIDER
jgi:hypothetical protein